MYNEYTPSWSLLRLSPQSQSRYVGIVGELYPEIELYYPVFECMIRPHGKARAVKVVRPVYPGYVFAKEGAWSKNRLTSMPVRAYWVRFGGEIESVSDRVVQRIKEFEGRNELVQEVKYVNPYRAGVSVRVHLPVADLLAVIVKTIGDTRVIVDLPIGRCAVPIHCLEIA